MELSITFSEQDCSEDFRKTWKLLCKNFGKILNSGTENKCITVDEDLIISEKYGLKCEVKRELENGASPYEVLYEWDLLDVDEI